MNMLFSYVCCFSGPLRSCSGSSPALFVMFWPFFYLTYFWILIHIVIVICHLVTVVTQQNDFPLRCESIPVSFSMMGYSIMLFDVTNRSNILVVMFDSNLVRGVYFSCECETAAGRANFVCISHFSLEYLASIHVIRYFTFIEKLSKPQQSFHPPI